MKKILFSLFLIMGTMTLLAQSDTLSLKEYTGKYLFPEGNPVSEISVTMESGILTATSVMGNSELKKTDTKDVFEVVAYAGTATFNRGEDGKIKTLRVQVQDVDMEGTRDATAAFAGSRQSWWRKETR